MSQKYAKPTGDTSWVPLAVGAITLLLCALVLWIGNKSPTVKGALLILNSPLLLEPGDNASWGNWEIKNQSIRSIRFSNFSKWMTEFYSDQWPNRWAQKMTTIAFVGRPVESPDIPILTNTSVTFFVPVEEDQWEVNLNFLSDLLFFTAYQIDPRTPERYWQIISFSEAYTWTSALRNLPFAQYRYPDFLPYRLITDEKIYQDRVQKALALGQPVSVLP